MVEGIVYFLAYVDDLMVVLEVTAIALFKTSFTHRLGEAGLGMAHEKCVVWVPNMTTIFDVINNQFPQSTTGIKLLGHALSDEEDLWMDTAGLRSEPARQRLAEAWRLGNAIKEMATMAQLQDVPRKQAAWQMVDKQLSVAGDFDASLLPPSAMAEIFLQQS